MSLRNDQNGFSVFEIILLVVVLAALAVIGLRVLNNHSSSTKLSNSTTTPARSSDVSTAPAVNSSADLNKAQATLDQNDPSSANNGDSNELNNQLNGF